MHPTDQRQPQRLSDERTAFVATLDMFIANHPDGKFEVHAPDGDYLPVRAEVLSALLAEVSAAAPAVPGGWVKYELGQPLPEPGTVVLLWAVEDYWTEEGRVVRGELHLGEVVAAPTFGDNYLSDYMDTEHSAISHWALPAAPTQEERHGE